MKLKRTAGEGGGMRWLVLLALAVSPIAVADTLWGKAVAGASVAEVKAAIPEATDHEPTPDQKIKSGAKKLLTLTPVPVAGKDFTAEFFFGNDNLEQVSLSFQKPGIDPDDCHHTSNSVVEALRAKYGKELTRDVSSRSASMSWSSGKTSISLFTLVSGSLLCTVHVSYNNRIGASASNL